MTTVRPTRCTPSLLSDATKTVLRTAGRPIAATLTSTTSIWGSLKRCVCELSNVCTGCLEVIKIILKHAAATTHELGCLLLSVFILFLVWEPGIDPQAAGEKDLQQHGQRLLGEEKKRPQCLPTGKSFTFGSFCSRNSECLYCLASFCGVYINNLCVCVPVAAEPRDGEGLSNSDSLCLWLPREQSLQQGQGRVCTQGYYIFFKHFSIHIYIFLLYNVYIYI